MAKYGIRKTISYDVWAEVEAETEAEVYEMLDNNAIEFQEDESKSIDEALDVYLVEGSE